MEYGMDTQVVKIEGDGAGSEALVRAAGILRTGGLVAFPTETVYGLGANALDETAAAKIYAAKGRPSDNPLIVHIADIKEVKPLVSELTETAKKLMEAFWPGPLTLVLPKSGSVPETTTGGLDTVAIRMPSHGVALQMIAKAGVPIAAPSANASGRPSPTTAAHVFEDMNGRIELILDGGEVGIGVESTIVDVTGEIPVILRPGFITKEMVCQVVGRVEIDPAIVKINEGHLEVMDKLVPKAPGMKYRHYAPRAPLTLVQGEEKEVCRKLAELAGAAKAEGKRVGIICSDEAVLQEEADAIYHIGKRKDTAAIARNLYSVLRQCDEDGIEVIFADSFELEKDMQLGYAILNRLMKAAGGKVIR